MRSWHVQTDRGWYGAHSFFNIVQFAEGQRGSSLTRFDDCFIDSFVLARLFVRLLRRLFSRKFLLVGELQTRLHPNASSYFSMQARHLSPFPQSAISTAGLVVFSFQQVQAHSSLPGARMHAILLPTTLFTLRGYRSLSLF